MSREALRLVPWGLLLFLFAGCSQGVPHESVLADLQERKLWRSEAAVHAPDEYRSYLGRLRRAKDQLIRTEGRFPWLRDWDEVAREYRTVIASGDAIYETIRTRRDQKKTDFAKRLETLRGKIERLDNLSTLISVGRTYQEISTRKFLAQADLLAGEAAALIAKEKYPLAEERLKRSDSFAKIAREAIAPALKRFVDRDQITSWRTRVDETISESRARGGYAIVVSKVDRKLVLYKEGRPLRTYNVGIGAGSIRDKVCAGDRATPEGRYRIVRKLPKSRFYKALLIDYPNADDLRQFAALKRQGALSRRAGIGGMIEIHGGGRDGMTLGCVALDDSHMEELFRIAEVGTPVTIVGATDYENCVAQAMKGL